MEQDRSLVESHDATQTWLTNCCSYCWPLIIHFWFRNCAITTSTTITSKTLVDLNHHHPWEWTVYKTRTENSQVQENEGKKQMKRHEWINKWMNKTNGNEWQQTNKWTNERTNKHSMTEWDKPVVVVVDVVDCWSPCIFLPTYLVVSGDEIERRREMKTILKACAFKRCIAFQNVGVSVEVGRR